MSPVFLQGRKLYNWNAWENMILYWKNIDGGDDWDWGSKLLWGARDGSGDCESDEDNGEYRGTGLKGFQHNSQQLLSSKDDRPIESFANLFAEKHLCELCEQSPMDQSLRFLGQRYKLCDSLSELRARAKSCTAYMIMLASIQPYIYPDLAEIYVFAERLCLTEEESTKTQTTSLPRVIADLGPSALSAGGKREIPVLPQAKSEFDFLLYREWLRVCDNCHKHVDSYVATLPTRVIDVGNRGDSTSVRLRVTNGQATGIYIALSHRWQNDTPTTTTDNLSDRLNAIRLDDLPETYQEAVRVTRKLGVRFLWIDSLCIVQDSLQDWAIQSQGMEGVFGLAYCIISTSSEKTRGSFESDIENGELSRRGWILQERALARRTIYFTGEQIHWECGSTIWSKTEDKGMRPRNILASSQFPEADLSNDWKGGRTTFQDTFALYSRLNLTKNTDRPAAVAGLEFRMMTFYRTISLYGIVQSYFGESLLWQRSGDKWMEPIIDFDQALSWSINGRRVPSWSWMAYAGEIKYGDICTDGLSWKTDVKFSFAGRRFTLVAPRVRLLSECRVELYGDAESVIRNKNEDLVGWIRYDCRNEDNPECIGCVILAEGTTGWREYAGVSQNVGLLPGGFNYVLLVTPVAETEAYRRLGVAVILERYLSPSGDMVQVY